jgi:hypothetical protein
MASYQSPSHAMGSSWQTSHPMRHAATARELVADTDNFQTSQRQYTPQRTVPHWVAAMVAPDPTEMERMQILSDKYSPKLEVGSFHVLTVLLLTIN